MTRELSPSDIEAFEPEAKIGLIATVSPNGLPHLTLITTLQAKTERQLMFGQFCEGRSKANLESNPRCAFLVMSLEREIWRGTATWTHSAKEGEDYVRYNQLPMFRYNSYFGIHTVHFMDLESFTGKEQLSIPNVVAETLATSAAGGVTSLLRTVTGDERKKILKPWAIKLVSGPTTLKFLAYVNDSGFPHIIPFVPAFPNGPDRLTVGPVTPSSELDGIAGGTSVAILALNLEMESVLIRGAFSGIDARRGKLSGTVGIDWVYNSMPPLPGQIYPELELEPVTDFT